MKNGQARKSKSNFIDSGGMKERFVQNGTNNVGGLSSSKANSEERMTKETFVNYIRNI